MCNSCGDDDDDVEGVDDDDDDGQQGSPIQWEWLYGNRQGRWHFHRVTGKGMGLPLYYDDDDSDDDGVEEIGSKIPRIVLCKINTKGTTLEPITNVVQIQKKNNT